MFSSPNEKMTVSLAVVSNIAVTARASIDQKATKLFLKGVFKIKLIVKFTWIAKNKFQFSTNYVFVDCLEDEILTVVTFRQNMVMRKQVVFWC